MCFAQLLCNDYHFRRSYKSAETALILSVSHTWLLCVPLGSILSREISIQNPTSGHQFVFLVEGNGVHSSFLSRLHEESGGKKQAGDAQTLAKCQEVLHVCNTHLPFEKKAREPRNLTFEETHIVCSSEKDAQSIWGKYSTDHLRLFLVRVSVNVSIQVCSILAFKSPKL